MNKFTIAAVIGGIVGMWITRSLTLEQRISIDSDKVITPVILIDTVHKDTLYIYKEQ
jgi:hypothetical protein